MLALHRRTLLIRGSAASALVGAAAVLVPAARPAAYVLLCSVFLLSFVMSLVIANVLNRRRPRALDLLDGAFDTPRLGVGPLMALSVAPAAVMFVVVGGLEIAAGRDQVTAALIIGSVLGFWGYATRAAWVGAGARLTPAAIVVDGLFSSVVVPWEALDPESPVRPGETPFQLRLVFARPDPMLGGDSRKIDFEGVDTDFLAGAIAHYAAEPGHRAAIGTAAELERLRAAVPAPAAVDPATETVLKPGTSRTGIVIRLLLVFGGIALASADGVPGFVGNLVAAMAAASLAGSVRPGVWFRRQSDPAGP